MKKFFIGIDPGKTGGVCVLNQDQKLVFVAAFDKMGAVSAISSALNVCKLGDSINICVEKVHSMPAQGVKSTFTFGTQFGKVLGCLEYAGFNPDLFPPQTWMKRYASYHGVLAKERVRSFVDAEYGLEGFILPRCRTPHSGMMDAVGLTYFYAERLCGKA